MAVRDYYGSSTVTLTWVMIMTCVQTILEFQSNRRFKVCTCPHSMCIFMTVIQSPLYNALRYSANAPWIMLREKVTFSLFNKVFIAPKMVLNYFDAYWIKKKCNNNRSSILFLNLLIANRF